MKIRRMKTMGDLREDDLAIKVNYVINIMQIDKLGNCHHVRYMDIISVYSALQEYRNQLQIPYFTIQQFIYSIHMRDPADKLLIATIFYSLFKCINNKQNIKNVLPTSVTYQNSNQSTIKHLQINQIYQEFNQLSFSSKIDTIGQYLAQSMSELSYKYSGSGEQTAQQIKQQNLEIKNQNSLGFDIFGNEFHLFYPNILVVLTQNGQKLHYKSLHQYKQALSYDEVVYNQPFLKQFQGTKYDNLNSLLKKKRIFSDDEQIEQKMQIDIPVENIFFYNFEVDAEVPQYEEVKCEDKTFVEKLISILKSKNIQNAGKKPDLMQYIQAMLKENQDTSEQSQENASSITDFINELQQIVAEKNENFHSEEQIQQIQQNQGLLHTMIYMNLSYKCWLPNIIKYLTKQSHQLSNVQSVSINIFQLEKPQVLLDLMQEMQENCIQLIKQQQLSYLHLSVTGHMISNLKKTVPTIYNSRLADYMQINVNPRECLIELSRRANFHTVSLDTKNRDSPVLQVKKPINYKLGNLWLLKEMPIFLRDRNCLSKNNYVIELMLHLGYDEPIYEEPKEEVYEKEEITTIQPQNQQRSYFQNQNYLNFGMDQNLDTYQLDGFVVDDDEDDVDVMYSEDPAEMRKRQQRKIQRRQLRQQMRQQNQLGFPRVLADQQIQQIYGRQNTSQLEMQQMRQQIYAQAYRQQAIASQIQHGDGWSQNNDGIQQKQQFYNMHNGLQQVQPQSVQSQNNQQQLITNPNSQLKVPELPKIPLNIPVFSQNIAIQLPQFTYAKQQQQMQANQNNQYVQNNQYDISGNQQGQY